eukprot:TRINITY_DN21205_c0_g1_i1.p1 TRINITY_DN21205_c0_g1~~TRINITY_DN21205_c0_g1_i1.p1  ORF type:complete len:342 (+),score=70.97 TRINITY_DN21205_c0_g1_i1:70-1095(+)
MATSVCFAQLACAIAPLSASISVQPRTADVVFATAKMSSMAAGSLLHKKARMTFPQKRAVTPRAGWLPSFSSRPPPPVMEAKPSIVEELFSVKGKTALVTGAASGIGRQVSLFLAKAGANVVISDSDVDKLPALAEEITALGKGKAHVTNLDVLWSEDKVDAAVGEAWTAFGRIDILFNNAGVFDKAPSVIEATVEQFDHQYGTNVKGLWLVAKAVAKRQVADGQGGSIINNSAFAATTAVGAHALYSSTKAAVNNLTEHLARDLGQYKIRVNTISPGVFPTNMTAKLLVGPALDAMKKVPLGRIGDTEKDLNGAVLLLASDAGAFITGSIINVNGGFHIR